MRLVVNGEDQEAAEGTTVRDLLVRLGLGGGLVAVERNGEVVPRAEHAATALSDGDRVEVVHFVGGG
ncbi:MAG: sulfur carrier protein ThiS [Polyangiaceae bacterium]|nr:sulfur carrier protein ThiS [Polyangiaceae bacterium]